MSNGSYPSSSGRHPSRHRHKPDPSDVEANLAELGLITTRHRKKKSSSKKAKVVEFGSPVEHHSTYTQFFETCFPRSDHSCLF